MVNHNDIKSFLATLEKPQPRAVPIVGRIPNMVRHNRGETLEARYDAAQTTETNARHWSMADLLNADESNSPHVRSTLRTRARYECLQANSYGRGIVETLSLDLVGSGPRIQVLTDNEKANSIIQNSFHRWMRRAKIARKLRTMRLAKCVDGEAFAEMVTNPNLDQPSGETTWPSAVTTQRDLTDRSTRVRRLPCHRFDVGFGDEQIST
jgi:hypothetical protein